MDEKFSRTEMLIGNEGMEKLKNAKVAVFGLGGVGSFVCEGLARSGIGNFVLVDFDKVDESNINRQLIATTKTIGRNKVDVMKERILDINPEANIEIYNEFYLADSESDIITEDLSYVVDCVDDIYKTSYCPLARIMKKDLKKRNIKKLKVLYSKEHPINTNECEINQNEKKHKVKGSVSFMPPVAGLMIAGEVIKDIAVR